eukprot:TRINITY_DN9129_c0_g1_i4.p2 TRINITY_DN9129_c0_g1~~TRINITY_DN9129_c0_g1_i4.p2  ORF type:complete len:203 (-),score=44.98 TRINITY_DN9129_c0_g1_i4:122-730(-)
MNKAKVGEKPLVVVTHSLGTLVFKRILEYANKGDPRLESLKQNLKGVVFIAGPNKGISFIDSFKEDLKVACYMPRFDSLGSLAVSQEEALDYFLATLYYSKTTYYMARRLKTRLEKLQENFDKMKIKGMTISEGQPSRIGPTRTKVMIVDKAEAVMEGYPNVHIESKNHSETNKIRNKDDPTLIAVSKFIDESFGQGKGTKG